MIALNKMLFQVIFCGIILYQISLIQSQCIDNNLGLLNEEDNTILFKYLDTLEYYTGLSRTKPSIPVNCPTPVCIVNSQGSAIWEARLDFYTSYLINSSSNSRVQTIDGCICHSKSNINFQRCMQKVRSKMLVELETTLVEDFRNRVEKNECQNYEENCLPLL